MTWDIIFKIILFGIALSMDAFAVSITDGLIYTDINKKKSFVIALTFGIMQALMPLLGYWIVELVAQLAGAGTSKQAGEVMALTLTWIAFGLLLIIGIRMIIGAIISIKKPTAIKESKLFSYKEVFIMGIATSIDALAVGVSLHSGTLSNNSTIWLHVAIILVCTFIISLLGVLLGHFFEKLLKGKYEICSIIGGSILVILAVWVVISHYFGI